MLERYSSRPWHLLFPVLLLAVASLTIAIENWFWFGLAVMLLGWTSGAWIILSGMWESHAAYWDSLTRFGEVMAKNRNPHLWAAMGFLPPAESFKVAEDLRDTGTMGVTRSWDLPGSEIQFSTLCDGVLMGQSLSESFWAGPGKTYSSPVFRNLKKELEQRKLIVLRMAGKPTQGFELTRKGREFFMQHASVGIRQMLEEQKCLVDNRSAQQPQLLQ
jgi:hypothetical protein